jgi:hypothetical protein
MQDSIAIVPFYHSNGCRLPEINRQGETLVPLLKAHPALNCHASNWHQVAVDAE